MEQMIGQLLIGLQGIWKYRWLALIVTWLVALAGWSKVALLPDDYQTTARVFVDTQSILKPLLSGMTSVPNIEQQVAIMSRTLLSRPNIERVMRMVDMDLNGKTARDHEQLADELLSHIRIGSTGSYDIYTISYNHPNPRMVRDVVQALLTIFVEGSLRGKSGESHKAVQFIDEQIRSYEDKLVTAENALKDFKLRNSALLPRQGIDYSGQVLQSADTLNAARLELLEAEQARAAIQAQIRGDAPVIDVQTQPAEIDNPDLDGRIAALNKNLDALRMQYTEQHPDILAARRLISQLEARKLEESRLHPPADPGKNYSPMLQQLKVAQTEADARVASIQARVQEYAARHQRLVAAANAVPEVESELAQLNRDYLINKDNYEKLVGRREAAKLSGELSATTEMMSFKIIDPPTVPLVPVGPHRLLLSSLVLGAALLTGIAAALMVSQIRPTYLSPAELRNSTGLPVLGTVSMNWTSKQRSRRQRGRYAFGAGLASLFAAYASVLAVTTLR